MAFAVSKVFQKSALARRIAVRKASRSVLVHAASDRPLWFPGNDAPAHLDGTLAGDYGFDPLGLGADPESLRWNVQAELIHCRTAMTAVAGILFPAIATKAGALNVPEWYESGKAYIESPGAIPFGTLVITMHFFYGWAEIKRWQDFASPGSQADGSFLGITDGLEGKENGYPGGRFFDFMGLSHDPALYANYKAAEVKNGRLAMVALVGFVFQHLATGKGPIDNLVDHIADPFHTTFTTNGVSVPAFHQW